MRFLVAISWVFLIVACSSDQVTQPQLQQYTEYAAQDTSNYFVGIEKCATCHQNKFDGFTETGMGRSYGRTHGGFSVIPQDTILNLYDSISDFNYRIRWKEGKLWVHEYRLLNGDTIHSLKKEVSHTIGSGHHTNSHIEDRNGYLHQMPFTFYVEKGKVDLPPGFEDGFNSRFSRSIGLECMSCHNSYPEFVKGSENKFVNVPNGINCERCHGPGGKHVELMEVGVTVNTQKEVDYSIVHPGKLEMNLQFDVCQRCHLQGNTILKDGKSFFDFQPSMKLSEVMTVFLPRYENGENDFIMASHADRMQMSQCFISLKENAPKNDLYPAQGQMTCITCHDPHQSVQKQPKAFFNAKCQSCHQEQGCKANHVDNCVSCHMPKSTAIDIPHITITDHYIRIPADRKVSGDKKFSGLVAVNEVNPDDKTMLSAYINQFEKFDNSSFLLDSAETYVNRLKQDEIANIHELVHYYFVSSDYQSIVKMVKSKKIQNEINAWKEKEWDNQCAWTAYRIGEALVNLDLSNVASNYFKKAVELAPYQLDFQNKLGINYFQLKDFENAKKTWEFILKEDEEDKLALSNYGYYLMLVEQNFSAAEEMIDKAVLFHPDYMQAWLNRAQVKARLNKVQEIKFSLEQVLRIQPGYEPAIQLLKSYNEENH